MVPNHLPLYGTLAVDRWAVTFGTARRAWAGCGPAQSPSSSMYQM